MLIQINHCRFLDEKRKNYFELHIYLFILILEYFEDWKWCCKYINEYSDMIPNVRWGRYQTLLHVNHNAKEREMWTKKDCNHLIGGKEKTFCLGITHTNQH